MDRGASLRTGDVGSGPGGTKDARKKVLGPHDGGGGPSTVIALGGNGSGSSQEACRSAICTSTGLDIAYMHYLASLATKNTLERSFLKSVCFEEALQAHLGKMENTQKVRTASLAAAVADAVCFQGSASLETPTRPWAHSRVVYYI